MLSNLSNSHRLIGGKSLKTGTGIPNEDSEYKFTLNISEDLDDVFFVSSLIVCFGKDPLPAFPEMFVYLANSRCELQQHQPFSLSEQRRHITHTRRESGAGSQVPGEPSLVLAAIVWAGTCTLVPCSRSVVVTQETDRRTRSRRRLRRRGKRGRGQEAGLNESRLH